MCKRTPENTLPRMVEARKLVATEARFTRRIATQDLQRLAACSKAITAVNVDVSFGRDEQGRPILSGQLDAELVLECQRCLQEMPWSVTREVDLKLVWDELEAKALPKHAEPWIVGEGAEDLVEILEEEILLAMPAVPKHEHECIELNTVSEQEELVNPQASARNPFSVLADLNLKTESE